MKRQTVKHTNYHHPSNMTSWESFCISLHSHLHKTDAFIFIRSDFICFNLIKPILTILTYIEDCGQSVPGDGGGHGGTQLQAAGQRHLQVQDQEIRGRGGGARGWGGGRPRAHSLQSGLRLLHGGQGLLQLPGVGWDLGPGDHSAAQAPRQACPGVRDPIWSAFHSTLSFTVMPVSVRKIRA